MKLHAEARVGLVGAVGVHRVPVGDAAQGQAHLDAHLGERLGEHALEAVHDVVLLDEAHLDVDLGELGLAVGAQVLVAEALGNLVVALDAADHEQLLEQLRRLRQRVEVARLGAARDQEVAGALGGRLEERRRLDLAEQLIVQGLADREREVGAQAQVGHHGRTADVEVAVAQADVVGGVHVVLDREGRRLGGVEHHDLADDDLDRAGGQAVVGLPLDARLNAADDLDGPLGTDGLGGAEALLVAQVGVELQLREALAVAQVDEDQAAVVAAVPDPAGERDGLADVLAPKLAAGVRVHAEHVIPLLFRPVPCRAGLQVMRASRRPRAHAVSHDSSAPRRQCAD